MKTLKKSLRRKHRRYPKPPSKHCMSSKTLCHVSGVAMVLYKPSIPLPDKWSNFFCVPSGYF